MAEAPPIEIRGLVKRYGRITAVDHVDLTVNLERPPHGEWMVMAAQTRIGDSGAGLCTAVLSDRLGRVGVSAQSLLVQARS